MKYRLLRPDLGWTRSPAYHRTQVNKQAGNARIVYGALTVLYILHSGAQPRICTVSTVRMHVRVRIVVSTRKERRDIDRTMQEHEDHAGSAACEVIANVADLTPPSPTGGVDETIASPVQYPYHSMQPC